MFGKSAWQDSQYGLENTRKIVFPCSKSDPNERFLTRYARQREFWCRRSNRQTNPGWKNAPRSRGRRSDFRSRRCVYANAPGESFARFGTLRRRLFAVACRSALRFPYEPRFNRRALSLCVLAVPERPKKEDARHTRRDDKYPALNAVRHRKMGPERWTGLESSSGVKPASGRGEYTVANQGRPTHGSRMQLAEAAAVRPAPRARVTPMPIANKLSRASAPQAPYQAKATGTSATATTISIAESNMLKGCASPSGRPKLFRALLDPLWSRSFVTPARTNTVARRSLTANSASSTILGSCHSKYTRRPP